jgi:predicted amidohydrolase
MEAWMPRSLEVGLVQHPPAPEDWDGFARDLRVLVSKSPTVDMWVFPEMHLVSRAGETAAERAVRLDDARVLALGELARELGVWLVPGTFYELADDGRVHNTALVFDREGERVATYRKIFPWRPFEPTDRGVDFEVFEVPGYGTVGLSICFDIWFPEHARHLAWLGADLILNLTYTEWSDREQELTIVRANAIMNQVWVASVNTAAPGGRGRSLVVDPDGAVTVASPDAGEEVLTAVVDFDRVDSVRRHGTAGVTFPWAQYREGDPEVPVPLYGGRVNFENWAPSRREVR